MHINQVISIKCILFTYICTGPGYIAIYHVVDFLETCNEGRLHPYPGVAETLVTKVLHFITCNMHDLNI